MKRLQLALLFLAAAAVASPTDPRGWGPGKMAAGTSRILAGPPADQLPALDLPKSLAKKIDRKTVLFYFSPTCPHCRAVGPEVGDLARAIASDAAVIGIASGGSLPTDLLDFKRAFGIDFEVVIDTDRSIGSAMGVRSTPSAMLVEPTDKGQKILDAWYPYQGGYDTYVTMRVRKDPWSVFDGSYAGSGSCGGCHLEEAASWALSHHSVAWRTLTTRAEHTNPECTNCHVTGAGQPTGWTGESTPNLVDVQCEACHGPGGPHDGERTDPRTTCAGCHDSKHSIDFSVAKGLPLVDHYAASSLSDEAFREKRKALVNGELPRPLLAFDASPTLGAEACRECHPTSYAWWKENGHHDAMAVLKDDAGSADNAQCVRCHATASRGGPVPSELEEFRVDEGVGCEACHGPATAHVASGGAPDTIEGLGEDCPVCVIEAVCTSCHTAEWDKDWDLDTHLPKVKHPHASVAAPPAK